jgi:hypothetical protein
LGAASGTALPAGAAGVSTAAGCVRIGREVILGRGDADSWDMEVWTSSGLT